MSGSELGPKNFENGTAEWVKLQFTVQVSDFGFGSNPAFQRDNADQTDNYGITGKAKDANTISVILNHEKHQKHAWVTENDLMEFINSGLFPVDETKQYQSMLDAFSLYRQDAVKTQNGLVQSPTSSYAPSSSSDSIAAFPASASYPTEPMNSPRKTNKRASKKKTPKADKAWADPSHFHRFRIS